jgi:hypothetical protein
VIATGVIYPLVFSLTSSRPTPARARLRILAFGVRDLALSVVALARHDWPAFSLAHLRPTR